jgi:hypothetical protein
VTRYSPLWQQAGTYPAGTDRGLLGALWPASGSTGGAATTVANTMNVSVAPGTAAVALGTAGALTQLCRWDAAEVVTLVAAPPAGSSRIDLVVLQVRDNTLDSGGNNDFIFQAIAGAGGTPGPGAVPAVPNNAYAVAQLTIGGGIANLNGVTVVNRRVSLNPAMRVYQAAAQALPATAVTKITFDTVDFDPYGLYAMGGTQAFTAPVAGHYLASGRVEVAAGTRVFAELWRNGTSRIRGADGTFSAGANAAMNLVGSVMLAAGDTLDLRGFSGVAANTAPGATPQTVYFDVSYLGTGT